MSVIFGKSVAGRRGVTLPQSDVPDAQPVEGRLGRGKAAHLCELSELDVVRHFTELSRRNFGVDTNFYPLGSCTMKYNPKIAEKVASLDGFAGLHPLLPQLRRGGLLTQGALSVLYDLEKHLCAICGMDAFTLHPLAGAHGELTGMMLVAAYHRKKGSRKNVVLIPDEAHGTNPSSAAIAGFEIRTIPTDTASGTLDIAELEKAVGDDTAALMLTNPSTLGIFNGRIEEIARIVHRVDAQLYYDGANLNAILGKFRPGDALFDVMHVNLHKTFATPHGGGGPGAGPVGVKAHLEPFLPVSRIEKRDDNTFALRYDYPDTIGYVAPFYGNFAVCLKAAVYILSLGAEGMAQVAENAVLNANYVMHLLKGHYDLAVDRTCMHECVLSAQNLTQYGVHATDVAKALIDRGFHPPTVYFPLIVKEALMIEPTECESKEMLDRFAQQMVEIAETAKVNSSQVTQTPVSTPVRRPDETKAARDMDFCYINQ